MGYGAGYNYGNNPMSNAAQGMSQAFNMYTDVANGYGSDTADTYRAATQAQPGTIAGGMSTYQNPYTQQVIDRTTNDMMYNRDLINVQNDADAARAGAFGGSRHALVEAATNADTNRNIGTMAAQLRNDGFNTAAALAGQDIGNQMQVSGVNQAAQNTARQFNAGQRAATDASRLAGVAGAAGALGNLSQGAFGMGNTINQQQMQSGGMTQALLQQLLTGGQGLYSQYMAQPQQLLQMRLASLGQSPLNAASTSTETGQTPNTLGANLIGAAGNMFQFAPIALSDGRLKHDVKPTGRMVISRNRAVTQEVKFRYLPELDPDQIEFTGVIADGLGDDPAVIRRADGLKMVDYSQLEIVQ